jgi:predicted nucleic acid-binding protein
VTFLLDTNVLSETRKRQPDVGVAEWVAATPAERLYVSVLTLGEIARGIVRVRARGDHQQATTLERWLGELEAGFVGRVMPVSLPVASVWGRQQQVRSLPVVDALIAATARVNGLTMVTRNVKDFQQAGIEVLNPFAG